jgi:hypothetical protein
MKKLLLTLLLFVCLWGYAAEQRPPATGKIIVYRIWRLSGSAGSISFRLDGGPIEKLQNGYYLSFAAPPGDHALVCTVLMRNDVVGVHVEPGQTVYVDAHCGTWGFTFERAEDQAQAKAVISTLRAQN